MPWIDTLDADHQAHATAKGWHTMEPDAALPAILKAHRAAEQHMGGMVRLPKDGTDPTYPEVYARVAGLGAPQSPDGYNFGDIKFKDGTALQEGDVAWVRGLAAKHKLPVHVATDLAHELAVRADSLEEASARDDHAARQVNEATLRSIWGAEYETKQQQADQALQGLKALGISVSSDGDHVKFMNGLLSLAGQLQEAPHLGGGGGGPIDNTRGMTPEQAQSEKIRLMGDTDFTAKLMKRDVGAWDQVNKLDAIIVAARMGTQRR